MPNKNRRYSTLKNWYFRELAKPKANPTSIKMEDPLSKYRGDGIAAYKAFAISLNQKPGFRGDGLSIVASDVPNDTDLVVDLMLVILRDYELRNQNVDMT